MNTNPKRGEVWYIDLNPTKGAEINKIRTAVVVSSDSIGKLPIKLIAPITGWKEIFTNNLWHVKIQPNIINGLTKDSAVDTLQVRGVDISRFRNKIGYLSAEEMDEIVTAIAAIVEYE